MPQLEYDEGPESQGVIAASADVLANHSIDESAIEIPAFAGGPGAQHVGKEFAQVSAKPATDRNGEALFASVQDFLREKGRCRFFENVFLAAILDLEVRGDTGGKINDAVVEERHPRLDRMRHAARPSASQCWWRFSSQMTL